MTRRRHFKNATFQAIYDLYRNGRASDPYGCSNRVAYERGKAGMPGPSKDSFSYPAWAAGVDAAKEV